MEGWHLLSASLANYVCLCISVSLCKNTCGAWHGRETEGAKGSEVRKEARMQRRKGRPALDRDKMVLSRALAALVTRSESNPVIHVLY